MEAVLAAVAIVEGFLLPFTLAIEVNSNFCRRLVAFCLVISQVIEHNNYFAASLWITSCSVLFDV